MISVYRLCKATLCLLLGLAAIYQPANADDSCTPGHSSGSDVFINLNDDALPASDLNCDANCLANIRAQNVAPHVLDPEEAWNDRKQFGIDLSMLDPDASTDIWKTTVTPGGEAQDAALAINNKDQVQYQADICSSAGRYRFNARTQNGQTITLMLSKTLHTFLLRKELLRKLGYVIPAMKWLPTVVVHFPSQKIRDSVLDRWLPNATDGAATRWCGISSSVLAANKTIPCNSVPDAELGGDPLAIELQDVMAMEATPLYYNTAIGPPIVQLPNSTNLRPEQYRTLRALSVIYDLADVPESLNQLDWYAARIQSGSVYFHIDDQANFGTTLDDARWVARKIAQLTREDFAAIVGNASYPDPIAKLLVEKLISRRNSLVSALGISDISAMSISDKINPGPGVSNGKVTQQVWPGYADDFSGTDPVNPLVGIWWYILSEFESNAMESLVTLANNQIPSLSTAAAYSKHEAQLQSALVNAIANGKSSTIPFGVWSAPVVNGSVQFSRDIVLGQYLGTNNLVQLADTFGFTANAGLIIGVDGLAAGLSASGQVSGSASISLTHLKPLQSLKQGVTEPVVKELVPWVFGKGAGVLQSISDAQSQIAKGQSTTPPATSPVSNATLSDDLAKLQDYLGVGESLIVTTSLSGLQQLNIGYGSTAVKVAPAVEVSGEMNELVLSRVQFLRKDQNTIVVFKDNGELAGPTLSFEFTLGQAVTFPVIQISASGVSGSGTSNVYTIDITPDTNKNKSLFANTAALAKALRTGSAEPLKTDLKQTPIVIETKFTDKTSSFQFFHYFSRGLKTSSDIRVTLPDGFSQSFVKLSDGHQSGSNYQALATELATYLLQYTTGNTQYSINTQTNQNPGQSFFGTSQTRNASFEGVLNSANKVGDPPTLDQPYVNIAYRWEGWDITAAQLQKLSAEQSAKYGFQLYPAEFLGDTKDIKMYELLLGVNIYQSGITQILSMSDEDETKLLARYKAINNCNTGDVDEDRERKQTNAGLAACNAMDAFHGAFSQYRDSVKANQNGTIAPKGIAGFLNSALNFFHLGTPVPADGEKLAGIIFKITNNLEQFVSFKDFTSLVGGSDHLYISANITGFKNGSELSSDQPIVSNSFGKADNNNPSGPVSTAQSLLDVQAGEFNLSWIRSVL